MTSERLHVHLSDALQREPDPCRALATLLPPAGEARPRTLHLAPETYHLHPGGATSRVCYVSNHDSGEKPLAFRLEGVRDLVIDGHGAELLMHGRLVPFFLEGCERVRIRNLTIDWVRPFLTQPRVLEAEGDTVLVEYPEDVPVRVENGRILVRHEGFDLDYLQNLVEFDPAVRHQAFGSGDNFPLINGYRAAEDGPNRVRITGDWRVKLPTPGNVLVIKNDYRYTPAIVIADSGDVTIENVTIRHAGGMGVIAQRSRDITLERVDIRPPESGQRLFSCLVDATHFVACSGTVALRNCRFENQIDDASNIHGIYGIVARRLDSRRLELRVGHHQQAGVLWISPGDRIQFADPEGPVIRAEATAVRLERLDPMRLMLELEDALPATVQPGMVADNATANPAVDIRGCVLRGNRARGFLLHSRGPTTVRDCYFHTTGPALLISGAEVGDKWYESGYPTDVTIADNIFSNCNCLNGRGAAIVARGIRLRPNPDAPAGGGILRVEGNTFRTFGPQLLHATDLAELVWRRNRVTRTRDYPFEGAVPLIGTARVDRLSVEPPPDCDT